MVEVAEYVQPRDFLLHIDFVKVHAQPAEDFLAKLVLDNRLVILGCDHFTLPEYGFDLYKKAATAIISALPNMKKSRLSHVLIAELEDANINSKNANSPHKTALEYRSNLSIATEGLGIEHLSFGIGNGQFKDEFKPTDFWTRTSAMFNVIAGIFSRDSEQDPTSRILVVASNADTWRRSIPFFGHDLEPLGKRLEDYGYSPVCVRLQDILASNQELGQYAEELREIPRIRPGNSYVLPNKHPIHYTTLPGIDCVESDAQWALITIPDFTPDFSELMQAPF